MNYNVPWLIRTMGEWEDARANIMLIQLENRTRILSWFLGTLGPKKSLWN